MTAKQIFAGVGILCAIVSFVVSGPFVAAGVIAVGVAVILP